MKQILIYGCGNMGGAIAKTIAKQQELYKLTLLDTQKTQTILELQKQSIRIYNDCQSAFIHNYDLVIIAVKPNQANSVLASLAQYSNQFELVVSIMAGISFATLESHLPNKPMIRAMPNMPCTIGMGVIGYTVNHPITADSSKLIKSIFNLLGISIQVDNEDQINSLTAIAGSGRSAAPCCSRRVPEAVITNFKTTVKRLSAILILLHVIFLVKAYQSLRTFFYKPCINHAFED